MAREKPLLGRPAGLPGQAKVREELNSKYAEADISEVNVMDMPTTRNV